VGTVDEEGFFRITDRMKDIIITAGGKNITPSEIENQLKFSPYITDAVVIGDRRAYLSALVMIDQENVERYAQDNDIPFSNYASLCRASEIQALIGTEIERVNRQFARVEQVKSFRLIEQRLTAEDEELTPTMKLKRKLVQQKYALEYVRFLANSAREPMPEADPAFLDPCPLLARRLPGSDPGGHQDEIVLGRFRTFRVDRRLGKRAP
jgi:long-subunit acyl-CoA synthetase (AMP-forming)